jgi:hypothetical protein
MGHSEGVDHGLGYAFGKFAQREAARLRSCFLKSRCQPSRPDQRSPRLLPGRVRAHQTGIGRLRSRRSPAKTNGPETLRAHERGLRLTPEIAPDVPLGLIGDPNRLWQILVNLAGNALKFTERGSVTVCVRSNTPRESVCTSRGCSLGATEVFRRNGQIQYGYLVMDTYFQPCSVHLLLRSHAAPFPISISCI